jgi:hypothetical protein
MRANAFADYRARGERTRGGRIRLANARQWHCAEDGKAAGADARTSQKSAAIESGAVGSDACERAAARLTV